MGPAIAVWIIFAVLVMATYFLYIVPQRDADPTPEEPPLLWRRPPSAPAPRPQWVRPIGSAQPRSALPPRPPVTPAPHYDMEYFPDDKWGPTAA
jgi:hypothetical protein